ncbi:MAG: hypothetical protein KDH20_22370 [Rhodocyclaceae bacterium]|nr:hypothetical protein [Rhodocyclaceae bacterium]
MAARGFLGGGDLYINRYDPDTGLKVGRRGPFEVGRFEVKPNAELKEMVSKGRSTYGQVIESVPIQQPSDFTVVMSEVDKEGLTLALMGEQAAINQGAGTMTDEVLVAAHDKWVSLANRNIVAAGLTVQDVTDVTTYVLGTDYEINYRLGMIRALSTGAIGDGDTLHVDGSYNAETGTRISGSTQPQLRAEFVLDGINFADSRPVIVTVHEGVLTPDQAFDFLADDFGNITLSGRLKTPTGFTEPYTVDWLDA